MNKPVNYNVYTLKLKSHKKAPQTAGLPKLLHQSYYFNKLNADSQAGFCVAKLGDSDSGFNPPERLFSNPPALAIVVTVLAEEIRLFTSKPLLNAVGFMPPASVANA